MDVDQKALDAQLFIHRETLDTFAVIIPIGGDFEITRVPTLLCALLVKGTNMSAIIFKVFPNDIPSLAIAHCAPNCRGADATNHQRYSARLCRFGTHHKILPLHKLAME